jgi:hypothetical protein
MSFVAAVTAGVKAAEAPLPTIASTQVANRLSAG